MNKRLRLAVRNAACDLCKMSTQADGEDVCVTGQGPNDARIMVVTKTPLSDDTKMRREIEGYLREVGINPARVMWTSSIKCRSWDIEPSKTDLKTCRPYWLAELDAVNPDYVLALGTEPLFTTTGYSGIMKYRGGLWDMDGAQVFATISPSMVNRNPGLLDGFMADLHYFARLTRGEDATDPLHEPPDIHIADTKSRLKSMLRAIQGAGAVAYDIETTGAAEHEPDAAIVSLAVTEIPEGGQLQDMEAWVVPLFHPESPWMRVWERVLAPLGRAIAKVRKRVAHNGKFDSRWMRHFGADGLY